MKMSVGGELSHKNVDFAWLQNQALDSASKSELRSMQKIREGFIATGEYPEADREVILKLRQATLATTLNCSYSSLYAYQEIFLHREHQNWKQPDLGSGVVVDVGANEGLYAIAICRANPGVTVYCIEPNPITLRKLKKNLQLNNLTDRCQVIPTAIWSHAGRQSLEYLPFVTTNASLSRVKTKSRWLLSPKATSVEVQADTLDEILMPFDLTEISILKVDTEGSEAEILRGAAATLAKSKRVVIEYHSDSLRQEVVDGLTDDEQLQLVYETRDSVHATQSCGNLYFLKA